MSPESTKYPPVQASEGSSPVPDGAIEHYERLLAEHYTSMLGDFEDALKGQRELLTHLGVRGLEPVSSCWAIDLGAGPGTQSLVLADLGYHVLSVDTSERLLEDLAARRGSRYVEPVLGDMRQLADLKPVREVMAATGGFGLACCMGDTLTHLSSGQDVRRLFCDVHALLRPGGILVLSYRDLTHELTGLDRFIEVHSDPDRIMTCFLDYEPAYVIVHDLVHVRTDTHWALHKSRYRKLRLAPAWVREEMTDAGFRVTHDEVWRGLQILVGRRCYE